LYRALSGWCNYHTEQARLGIIGTRVLLKWSFLEISAPWQAWACYRAKHLLEQWHMMSSSKLAIGHRLMAVRFRSLLWQSLRFKSGYRRKVIAANYLAHYLNEWRIVAVRQKDMRETASTISKQWKREMPSYSRIFNSHDVQQL
jgi:hypothetical protein